MGHTLMTEAKAVLTDSGDKGSRYLSHVSCPIHKLRVGERRRFVSRSPPRALPALSVSQPYCNYSKREMLLPKKGALDVARHQQIREVKNTDL